SPSWTGRVLRKSSARRLPTKRKPSFQTDASFVLVLAIVPALSKLYTDNESFYRLAHLMLRKAVAMQSDASGSRRPTGRIFRGGSYNDYVPVRQCRRLQDLLSRSRLKNRPHYPLTARIPNFVPHVPESHSGSGGSLSRRGSRSAGFRLLRCP